MAVTTLDPNTALILIDLQKGVVATETQPYPAAAVVAKAAALAGAFRMHKLPVVLARVTDGPPGRNERPRADPPTADAAALVAELDRRPDDYILTKKTWGAFTHTGLEEHLRAQGVTQIVVAGIATTIGVETTVRQAYEAGFNVTLAVDAMTDFTAATHWNSVTHIFPRLGETGTTEEIIGLLDLR